ncbi:MAG: hypothetical protein V3R96_02845 [Dehalococcoidales bacterium]
MSTVGLVSGIDTKVYPNGETVDSQRLSVDELVDLIVSEEKPVTIWQAVTRLGDSNAGQVSATFNERTDEGILAKFRVGYISYYAAPMVALTARGPSLRTIMADLLRNPFLSFRYKVANKLKRGDKCSQPI